MRTLFFELFKRNAFGLTSPLRSNVRWKREPKKKPIWAPTAPSKLFRIHQKPNIPKEEHQQIVELYRYYRSHVKSIRHFLTEEHHKATEVGAEVLEQARREEEEHERLMEENRKENERIAQLRNERRARELQEETERLLKLDIDLERQKQEMKQKAEELVLQEKEQSANFITEENLEKAIEYALDNPVSYDFAIDLKGNKYWETQPYASKM